MSTYEYRPNGENTLPIYNIGTEGWVFNDSGRSNNILDDMRDNILSAIRTLFPVIGYLPSILAGWLAGQGAWCPTYGLWSGTSRFACLNSNRGFNLQAHGPHFDTSTSSVSGQISSRTRQTGSGTAS